MPTFRVTKVIPSFVAKSLKFTRLSTYSIPFVIRGVQFLLTKYRVMKFCPKLKQIRKSGAIKILSEFCSGHGEKSIFVKLSVWISLNFTFCEISGKTIAPVRKIRNECPTFGAGSR